MQEFLNELNEVVNKRGSLKFVCLSVGDAEELVDFLNEQEKRLEHYRRVNRMWASRLEEGF